MKMETDMNNDKLMQQVNHFCDQLKEQWSKLSERDLAEIRDVISTTLRSRYGITQLTSEEARKNLASADEWTARHQ